MLQVIFGILAGLIGFFAYVWYLRAILLGETHPNRMTWFIIAFVSWVILLTYHSSGADTTIWLPVGEALASSVIAILAIKHGVGGREERDLICLVGAILSLIVWKVFGSAFLGLIGGLAVDTFALWPTVIKSFKIPGEEDRPAWTMTQIANTFNILAINSLMIGIWIYPIWRFLLDGVVIYALYRRKR